jgi:uncharacterized protein (DUF58 family)
VRPTWRLLGALGLGGVVFIFGVSSGVAWLFLLGYGVWAVAIVSYPYARWSDRRLSGGVRVAGSAGRLREGDELTVGLELRAAGAGRGPARLWGTVAGRRLSAGAGVVPAAGWRADVRLGAVARGPVLAEAMRMETGDPLGLFRRRRRLPDHELALAHPLFASLSDHLAAWDADAEPAGARVGPGWEFAGVREYRPGDSTRRIHWRGSARRGRLVVREHEPPGVPTVLVMIDPAPPSREAADQVARIAASEVWDCVRREGRAALWAPGLGGAGPAGGSALEELLDWLARYPRLPAGDGAPPATTTVVAVACSLASPVLGHLDDRRRGAHETRAWLVAGRPEDVGADPAIRVVGTEWPLA